MRWLFDQIGTLAVKALNAVLAALSEAVSAIISAWPIGMPDLPVIPSELVTAWGWVLWTPLPVVAAFTLFLFLITVELAWQLIAVALRWGKVIE
jgi:hypothetical protein